MPGHGGLVVSAATFARIYGEHIVALAARLRRPAIYWTIDPVRVGGLMSYGPDFKLLHRASAADMDRILKGAKPSDLPVQAPDEIDLTVNLKTADAPGIALPCGAAASREVIREVAQAGWVPCPR